MKFPISIIALAVAAQLAAPPAWAAETVAGFYKDRKIDFIVGSEAGAAYDIWTRLIGRHYGKYIPGNPTFVVRNMPGAGHVVAANYLYGQAARDGSVVAMISRDLPNQQLRGNPAVKFKMEEFNWIGSPQSSNRVCVAYAGVKVQTARDLFVHELLIAGSGAAVSATPNLLHGLLGMKFKVVEGYPSTAAAFLAIERGEAEGICQNLAGTEAVRPGWLAAGRLKVLFNLEKERLRGIDAPSVHEFTKTDEQRRIVAFFNSSVELGWPVLTVPGVAADRIDALRRAFRETMKDPAFLEEAKKLQFDIDPVGGEALAAVAREIVATPQAIVDKTASLAGLPN